MCAKEITCMKLSIITINYNDAKGLAKTLKSVADQHIPDGFELEHIIVDGASTDGSIEVIRDYATVHHTLYTIRWVSEKDKGVYNAMNKGIEIALGLRKVDSFNRSKRSEDKNKGGSLETEHYIQILNAGDIFASCDVLAKVRGKMEELRTTDGSYPEMIYGNMLVDGGEGNFAGSKEIEYSLRQYYTSTMNHDCCWIKRTLFVNENEDGNQDHCYGLYDENLKIVSDWKWFLQAIGLGHVKPVYVDIDMTIFEGGGISSIQVEKRNAERRQVLEDVMPPAILADYDQYAFPMEQVRRLKKYHLWAFINFVERVLSKLERWHILK